MLIYATACKTNNNPERGIVHAIVASFSGQLRGWWDHYLTNSDKQRILIASKLDESGRPSKSKSGETVLDMIYTLIINIYKHFTGDTHKIFEKNREQLMNLRCSTLTDFKWYKDVFLSRVFQLADCHNAIWKEKFISGLPPLFAEKVRESLRQQHNNSLPYDQISYGELTQKINRQD